MNLNVRFAKLLYTWVTIVSYFNAKILSDTATAEIISARSVIAVKLLSVKVRMKGKSFRPQRYLTEIKS